MANKNQQKSAASGTKTEQHVGLGIEWLFTPSEMREQILFQLSDGAYNFIWGKERYIDLLLNEIVYKIEHGRRY